MLTPRPQQGKGPVSHFMLRVADVFCRSLGASLIIFHDSPQDFICLTEVNLISRLTIDLPNIAQLQPRNTQPEASLNPKPYTANPTLIPVGGP